MNYERFTLSELIAFLNSKGFSVSQSSVLRYVQAGYAMSSRRIPNAGKSKTRVYYHPLTAIEIMTAALLFKGDFLAPNSTARLPRFNAEHLFYARLRFYVSHYKEIRYDNADPFTLDKHSKLFHENHWSDFFEYNFECSLNGKSFQYNMNPLELRDLSDKIRMKLVADKEYRHPLREILHSSFHACTIAYKYTYLLLLSKYKNELLFYADSNEFTYIDEAKYFSLR